MEYMGCVIIKRREVCFLIRTVVLRDVHTDKSMTLRGMNAILPTNIKSPGLNSLGSFVLFFFFKKI